MQIQKNVSVIGCGYWGAKHARVLSELPQAQLYSVADLDPAKVEAITSKYATVLGNTNIQSVLEDSVVEAVIIATPASTHFSLASQALRAGKHVLVEKPLSILPEEAQQLVELAAQQKLTLMVGHTFEYHPAVEALRDVVQSGELGDLYYLDTARLNLGLYQRDVNVIHDLSPHDISIMVYVLGMRPVQVVARGYSLVHDDVVDVAYLEYRFANGFVANSRVSWLAPKKTREMTIVGSRRMVVYDDVAESDPVQIFDKGITPPQETELFSDWKFAYQYGSTLVKSISKAEPLKREVFHFLECVETGQTPLTSGENGQIVVSVLHAAQLSLANHGRPQFVQYNGDAQLETSERSRPVAVGAKARRIGPKK
jgi:predicted dehydrogenase